MKKKLDIIYEDKELLAINKPAKLLCVSTTKEKERTLYHEVREYIRKKNQKVFIVNKLDKDASGIVLFAKNELLKAKLQANWNSYNKEFIAVVEGKMKKSKDTIRCYLKENKEHFMYVTEDNKGLSSITNYEVLDVNSSMSLLNVKIKSMRKNQIRAVLSNIGNPIVGDKKYKSNKNAFGRVALHFSELEIKHPLKNNMLKFSCNAPKTFYLGFEKYKKL